MSAAHRARLLTGFVLLAVVSLLVWYLPHVAVTVFFAIVMLIIAWEWLHMLCQSYLGMLLPLAAVMALMFLLWQLPESVSDAWLLYTTLVWWLAIFILIAVWRPHFIHRPILLLFLRVGVLLAVPTAWLALIAWHRLDPVYLLYLIFLVAIADTAAFYVGRLWGRQKLAPTLSPGKTRAGLWGAMIAVLLFAIVAAWQFGLSWLFALSFVLSSLVATVLSVIGDLGESIIKRCAACKNSGRILPGHGGVFDRLDGLLAAAPAFYLSYAPLVKLL